MNTDAARLGVDVGGTFTDVALEVGARRWTAKVPTSSGAPEEGVLDGIELVLRRAGLAADQLAIIIHGTTLATNALIERKGARTALITTHGHRDALEIGTESRFHLYDLRIEKPLPLVPRDLRYTVKGRLAADGRELGALDCEAAANLVPLLQAQAIESLAIGFLHSYVDPAHERRVAAIITNALPNLPISLSSDVSPEIREFERISTTCANAYIKPLMAGYLGRLEARLRAIGYRAPVYLLHSGGGLMDLSTAIAQPIRLVESGPAGGAILAADIARRGGVARALAFDMGGTTAKIAIIDDGVPHISHQFEIDRIYRFQKGSGLPVRVPCVELIEIGAGGGSVARVDSVGRITVGPDSTGAKPGPACYGLGGTQPAVTDADLLLGRFGSSALAGGALVLDRQAASDAIQRAVAAPLQVELDHACLGIVEIVEEAMASAAKIHCVEAGVDPATRTLIAFGGGGPVHVAGVARRLGVREIVVPYDAGVGSAVGFLRAPVTYDVARTRHMVLATYDPAETAALVKELAATVLAVVRVAAPQATFERHVVVSMRYVGQGHEIPVQLDPRTIDVLTADGLRGKFEDAYGALYGSPQVGLEIELLTWRVGMVEVRPPDGQRAPSLARADAAVPVGVVEQVDFACGRRAEVPVYAWDRLEEGMQIAGPAIVAGDDTSINVPPGGMCRMDDKRNIWMRLEASAA
jgi:N-methylhydantoinase A